MNFADIDAEDLRLVCNPSPEEFLTESLRELVAGALQKPAEEWTANERFAIAFRAGVEVCCHVTDCGQLKWKTEACSIQRVGDRIVVAVHSDRRRAFPTA